MSRIAPRAMAIGLLIGASLSAFLIALSGVLLQEGTPIAVVALGDLTAMGLLVGAAWPAWRRAHQAQRLKALAATLLIPLPGLAFMLGVGQYLDLSAALGFVVWPLALAPLTGASARDALSGHGLALFGHALGVFFLGQVLRELLPYLWALAEVGGGAAHFVGLVLVLMARFALHGFLIGRTLKAFDEPVRDWATAFD